MNCFIFRLIKFWSTGVNEIKDSIVPLTLDFEVRYSKVHKGLITEWIFTTKKCAIFSVVETTPIATRITGEILYNGHSKQVVEFVLSINEKRMPDPILFLATSSKKIKNYCWRCSKYFFICYSDSTALAAWFYIWSMFVWNR